MDPQYVRELLAFDEKIALAKLEIAKSQVRAAELEYSKARFKLDWQLSHNSEAATTENFKKPVI
jgi:hypothetical protein